LETTKANAKEKEKNREYVINDLEKLKLEIGSISVKIEKPGMIWCRRPKPMQGCNVKRGKAEKFVSCNGILVY
jgi:hypothetical protein